MSRRESSLSPDYFAGLYADDLDPWRFATSPYERDKYAATLASLPRARYGAALEIGCAIGVFTRRLAERCDTLLALDVVPSVLDAARTHCAAAEHVRFALGAVPEAWPEGRFDLIVISEVAYFLDRADLARLAARVAGALRPDGDVILVHWTGQTDYPLSGDEAAEGFIAHAAFADDAFARVLHQQRNENYRLDLLRANPVPRP